MFVRTFSALVDNIQLSEVQNLQSNRQCTSISQSVAVTCPCSLRKANVSLSVKYTSAGSETSVLHANRRIEYVDETNREPIKEYGKKNFGHAASTSVHPSGAEIERRRERLRIV